MSLPTPPSAPSVSTSPVRLTAQNFDQELLDLYDYYAHGKIDRRTFIDRAGKFAVGGLTAAALLELMSPHYAFAAQVPKEDPRVTSETVTYPSPAGHGEIRGSARASGRHQGEARGGARGARESRPQSLH
jgi:carboxymethylenebutenolidase